MARRQLINLARTNLPRRTYYLRRISGKCRNINKVREEGKGRVEAWSQGTREDDQPIEPCLCVLTLEHDPTHVQVHTQSKCVRVRNGAGEINEIAETNAAKRRRLEYVADSGMYSGTNSKRNLLTGSIELLVLN